MSFLKTLTLKQATNILDSLYTLLLLKDDDLLKYNDEYYTGICSIIYRSYDTYFNRDSFVEVYKFVRSKYNWYDRFFSEDAYVDAPAIMTPKRRILIQRIIKAIEHDNNRRNRS